MVIAYIERSNLVCYTSKEVANVLFFALKQIFRHTIKTEPNFIAHDYGVTLSTSGLSPISL